MRSSRDCIEQAKSRLMQAGWATEDELKNEEKIIRTEVSKEVAEAATGSMPPLENLYEVRRRLLAWVRCCDASVRFRRS